MNTGHSQVRLPRPRRAGVPVVLAVCIGASVGLMLGFTVPWSKLDRQATTLICAHCTHLMHFGSVPETLGDDSFPVNPSTKEGPT